MKCLHNKVNIVPVIAKADTLTKKEVISLKQRILQEIQENSIQIYQFPEADEEEDDEEFIVVNKQLKVILNISVNCALPRDIHSLLMNISYFNCIFLPENNVFDVFEFSLGIPFLCG